MNVWQYVRELDVAECAQRFRNAEPFPHIYFDNFLVDSFAAAVAGDFPSYDEAVSLGRQFKAVNERGKVQITDSTKFQGAVLQLHQLLASPEFLEIISQITGIPHLLADDALTGGGMHQTGPRGHLDVHIDFNYIEERKLYRRLNILIFMNQGWQDNWGGALELWDKDVRTRYCSLLPIFNRCVIFETSEISYHGVTAVTCPDDVSRRSFAAYYYTNEAPAGYTAAGHSTIFRARPDEHWKKWVAMPLEQFGRIFTRNTKRFKSAIKKRISTE